MKGIKKCDINRSIDVLISKPFSEGRIRKSPSRVAVASAAAYRMKAAVIAVRTDARVHEGVLLTKGYCVRKMFVNSVSSAGNTTGKLTVIIVLAVFIVLATALPVTWAERYMLRIGDPSPSAVLPDLQGRSVRIPADLRDSVVILHFWASWCRYCLEEMPAFESLYGRYKEKGLVVLAVNVGQDEDTVRSFVDKLDISYPVLLDTKKKVAKKYGVLGLPRTYVLDRSGLIKYKVLGEAGEETFNKFILDLL